MGAIGPFSGLSDDKYWDSVENGRFVSLFDESGRIARIEGFEEDGRMRVKYVEWSGSRE